MHEFFFCLFVLFFSISTFTSKHPHFTPLFNNHYHFYPLKNCDVTKAIIGKCSCNTCNYRKVLMYTHVCSQWWGSN